MILVLLGTQDKQFYRLLEAISKAVDNKSITEKVIVQAGISSDYKDDRMIIHDFLPIDEIHKLEKEAKYIICHGGVGTITECIKIGKKIIVAGREKEFKEHTNNHQKEIINEFYNSGYILKLEDFNKLDKTIKNLEDFKPKKYKSNNKNFVKSMISYIDTI